VNTRPWSTRVLFAVTLLLFACSTSCVVDRKIKQDTYRIQVNITQIDGTEVPPVDQPMCIDLRGNSPANICPATSTFQVSLQAIGPTGQVDTSFTRFARLSIRPGSLLTIEGDGADGRNVLLTQGVSAPQKITVTGTFGDTRVWAEDTGYVPVDPLNSGTLPKCSNGIDDDGDGLLDYPADPGCEFANDDSEEGGTYAAGVSAALNFRIPTVAEVQGLGPATPFSEEAITIAASGNDIYGKPVDVVITRLSNNGFYVADVEPNFEPATGARTSVIQKDYGSLFVFNFSTPPGLRVCDKITFLSGTITEFFGYTEMSFPSYEIKRWDFRSVAEGGDGPCLVPDPFTLAADNVSNNETLEKVEAGMVRLFNGKIAAYLGGAKPQYVQEDIGGSNCEKTYRFTFGPGASNCDLDDSGALDFTTCGLEAQCSDQCYDEPNCSEFLTFRSRGNYRVILDNAPSGTLLVNTGAIPDFTPVKHAGEVISSLTGTLATFSGGNLNWILEARCPDDLVFCEGNDPACLGNPPPPVSAEKACVRPRTAFDNDEESN
jgi:hypothetical protein